VHPVDRFDSEGWFSSDQVIFLTVFRVFLVKKHAAFKYKDAISGFPVSPGSAEALVRCGGKIKYILIAYFLGNICAKNCRNRTVYVKIIAAKGGTFFETQLVENRRFNQLPHLYLAPPSGVTPLEFCRHLWYQKTRRIALSCNIQNIAGRFLGLVTKHACDTQTNSQRQTDGRMDGRTDRITTSKTALA